MGGSKSSSESATTTESNRINTSFAIDAASTFGDAGDVTAVDVSNSDNVRINMTDHGTVSKAIELAEEVVGTGADLVLNLGKENIDFLDNALDFVTAQAERNYDFATDVAIPLNKQTTEEFSKTVIYAAAAVAIAMVIK